MESISTTETSESEADVPRVARVWTVFGAFIIALVLQVGVGILAAVYVAIDFLRSEGRPPKTPELAEAVQTFVSSPMGLVSTSAAVTLLILGLSMLLGVLSSRPWRERLRLGPSGFGARTLLVATLGFFALSETSDALFALTGWQAKGSIGAISTAIERSPLGLAILIVLVLLLAGVSEELLFRGYMQTRLVERWGRWRGILIASALFGLMHLDLLQGSLAFTVGIYLGYIADRAGTIRPSMVAHSTNNAAWALITWFTGARLSSMAAAVLLVACVLSTVTALVVLRNLLPARTAS